MKITKSKILHVVLKAILTLMLIVPVFGSLGVFPEPTREMFNTDEAYNFINVLTHDASYISYLMSIVFVASVFLLWTKREALAALLITPITLNIVGFHAFLDGGLFTGGAVLGNALFILNIYFIWKNKEKYKGLLDKN